MRLGIIVLLVNFAILINGKGVSGDDYSFTAQIKLKGTQVCNGVLVDNQWVVTLKQCVNAKKLSQYMVYFSSSESESADVKRSVKKLVVPDKKNKDIIMLQLDEFVLKDIDSVTAISRFSTSKLDKKMKTCKTFLLRQSTKEKSTALSDVDVILKSSKKCKGKQQLCFDTKGGSVSKTDNGAPVLCKYQSKWFLNGFSFVNKKRVNKNIKGYRMSFFGSAVKKVMKANEVIGCGPVPDIANANVLLLNSTTDIGSQADVSCFQGYTTKKSLLTCLEARKWDTTTCQEKVADDYVVRLPNDFDPLYYDIELQPDIYNNSDPSEFTYTGSVTFTLLCKSDTSIITLNINGPTIEGPIFVNPEDSSENLFKNYEVDHKQEHLLILANTYMKSGQRYLLRITRFAGDLQNPFLGFYYDYDLIDGVKEYHAVTVFQPTYARTTFPCFDEPSIKSEFDITVVRKKSVQSLSNMPLLNSTERDNDWVADTFERTPKMPVYLVAIFLGNYEYLEKTTKNNVTFRTWAAPAIVDQTSSALDRGVKMQEEFVDYFKMSYPLPKLDNIGLPSFGSALELWGLPVYKNGFLVVDNASIKEKIVSTQVIAHEIVHTWVGNLVTPQWWDEIWLNEGFATYYEKIGVDFVHPEWKMSEQFIYEIIYPSLINDGNFASTHPLQNPIYKPADIGLKIFDLITYLKGGAIVRMLSFMVGENTFRKGMAEYVKKNSYKAVTKDDLWSAIEKQAKADKRDITNIKEIMDTWVLQQHFPLVEIEFKDEGKISVTQQKYDSNPDGKDPGKFISPYKYKWNIPFVYTTSKTKNFEVKSKDITILPLGKKKVTFKSDDIPKAKGNQNWVIANPQYFGFYRVNYDKRNWNALINQLNSNHEAIHVINRAQIIEDTFNLQMDGYQSLTIALKTLNYLGNEDEWLPLRTAAHWINWLENKVENMAEFSQFREFIADDITERLYVRLVETGGDLTDVELLLRDDIYKLGCKYGLENCLTETEKALAAWKADPDNLSDKEIDDIAYCEALSGLKKESEYWDFVFEQLKNDSEVNKPRLNALACSTNEGNLKRLIDYVANISADHVLAVVKHPAGRSIAWDYFLSVWDEWLVTYNEIEIAKFVSDLAKEFASDEDLEKVESFISDKADDLKDKIFITLYLERIVEAIEARNDWLIKNSEVVKAWLA